MALGERKLVVEIVGDSRSLERAMGRSEKAAKGFGATVDRSAKRLSAFQRGAATGFVGAAAVSSALVGLRDVVTLAAESEQVLGQTRVALESTGNSWATYGDEIQEAVKAQSRFGFDDEALLQSFSLFVRQSDSVTEALRRNRIAMDLARARFIDFESAALLVNKAALGQAGALRRVGIDARKGATGVELLAQLEREFGGAAEAASDDAATAMERLNVQVENAKESIGTLALPVVTQLATVLGDAVSSGEKLAGVLRTIGRELPLPEPVKKEAQDRFKASHLLWVTFLGPIKVAAKGIDLVAGAVNNLTKELESAGLAAKDLIEGRLSAENTARVAAAAQAAGGGVTAAQRNRWFDAMVGRRLERNQDIPTLRGQIADLRETAGLIQARMKATKDITKWLNLEDELLRVQRDIRARQADIAGNAADAARAAKDRQQEVADAARQQAQLAREQKLGWLEFALERAEATKAVSDDLKRMQAIENYWKERIRQEGRTLENVQELWRIRQRIRDANKNAATDGDPLAGLMQVSTKKLTSILAAGTGLRGAGRAALAGNISGLQLRPIQIGVNIDGREIGRATTKDQTRAGKRTSSQTSGRRG